ncbi:hypothetical protein KAT92_05280 [Candidatus Babeliales bacterium]|nr:hypothetical protein [Candidatus Babeliales bacterium]
MSFFDELNNVLHIGTNDKYVRVERDPRCDASQESYEDDGDEYEDYGDDEYDD